MCLKEFFNINQIEKTDNTIIERLKDYYNSLLDNELEPKFIIFLSESKHKIKKKAEQAACKMAYETIIAK